MKRTITTVICAVWHNDADRHRLLLQHCENCRGQTTSVHVIYVFDNNDRPPPSFRESAIISSEPLTIYEAWNLALAACRTPYVMNLNLDDSLCADAVEQLEDRVQEADAWLIGGDWKICHSQEETNEVGKCYPAHDIPFSSDWPPKKGVATRLGSGTGNRGHIRTRYALEDGMPYPIPSLSVPNCKRRKNKNHRRCHLVDVHHPIAQPTRCSSAAHHRELSFPSGVSGRIPERGRTRASCDAEDIAPLKFVRQPAHKSTC